MRVDTEDRRTDRLRLSIVIPSYNGKKLLERCLASVMRYRPADSEVIVVDDGSTDDTCSWVAAAHPEVVLVALQRNQGFCKAINAGIRAATGTVVETLNNDTVVTSGWAEAALAQFDDPRVGSVAPLVWLLNEDGLIDSAGDQYHVAGWAMNRGHRQPATPALLCTGEVFGTSASAGFFRRRALERVGGFPEHFGAYYDDIDLAFRLRSAGYRCVYTPESQVHHRLHSSYDHGTWRVVSRLSRNEEVVFWASLPAWTLLRALGPHALYVATNGLGRLLFGKHALAYFYGKLLALVGCRSVLRGRRDRRRLAREADFPVSLPLETDNRVLFRRMGSCLMVLLRRPRAALSRVPGVGRLRRAFSIAARFSSGRFTKPGA